MSSRILSSGYASHSELCHSWDYVASGFQLFVGVVSQGFVVRDYIIWDTVVVSVIVWHSYLREKYEPSVG